ncbi:tumor protein D52-like isoform X2 [Acanthaster planci]|uniref:Tumor protein D52-like isoform X2 n=1 Tax=Acanthaster planci TaxID=133434 RepID=A0A8B7Y8N1_ACAPL|nr:tumor protein D52-like isoform X2 [Acanthaster planci]
MNHLSRKKASHTPTSNKPRPQSTSDTDPQASASADEKLLYINESLQSFVAEEEGYGSVDERELTDDYKSPLEGAPSYHSYLSIVPDYGVDEDDGGGVYPKSEEPLSSPDSTPLYDNTPASTPSDLPSPGVEIERDEVERERLRSELAEVESDILTLRQTLRAKETHAKEIKRKLGITPINQMKEDFKHGWQNFQQSNAFNKTKSGLATAGQKTTSAFNTLGSAVSKKLGDMRESNTFKSFEEKVSSATNTIKTKVTGSKTQESSFEEVLQSTASAEQQQDSHTKTALLPEEKVPL